MREFHYSLIRYVPDRLRMEPINVGIVLQASTGTQLRFNPHATKRADIDTDAFRKWRSFFEAEVRNDEDPLFRPSADTPDFLLHLARLCDAPFAMTRPLLVADAIETEPDRMLETLFRRLVLPVEEASNPETLRPTARYRDLEAEFQLLKRGVKRYAAVPGDGAEPHERIHRRPYRQVANGRYIAMDKIEVNRELSRTAEELNALADIKTFLARFLEIEIQALPTRYILLADDMNQPFREQAEDDFLSMRDDIERTVAAVLEAGGEVIRDAERSEELAKELNRVLASPGAAG